LQRDRAGIQTAVAAYQASSETAERE
jgi:hypothetical protein